MLRLPVADRVAIFNPVKYKERGDTQASGFGGSRAVGGTDYSKVRRYLARRDPVLKQLMARVGKCQLRHDPDHFAVLARSIVSQQISTAAARSITARLLRTLAPATLRAAAILATGAEALRGAGLSTGKTRSLRDLAEKVHFGVVPLHDLPGLSDEEVIQRLLPVHGIGRWTAEMFLIFSLGRMDVLPVTDLGLRAGAMKHWGLPELPDKATLTALGEAWRPWRSVATWYVWRSFGPTP
jgi:DNA-3-methyladenine glycosylase II